MLAKGFSYRVVKSHDCVVKGYLTVNEVSAEEINNRVVESAEQDQTAHNYIDLALQSRRNKTMVSNSRIRVK